MIYISKGALLRPPGKNEVYVSRCGAEHTLSGDLGELWLNGRLAVAETQNEAQCQALDTLLEYGLAVADSNEGGQGAYRLLSNCVICPAQLHLLRQMLNKAERWTWDWITRAGFRLTMSELVFLTEHNMPPVPTLTGQENWPILVNKIYSPQTIQDGVLIARMAQSPMCANTVDAVLGLLRKKRVVLI